jgi:pimeloyl-ACP methyl ester carboxylesterase
MKIFKANSKVHSFLGGFNLRMESKEYKVSVYYVLGGRDWQAPYVIAEDYFKDIKAPNKEIFVIPNAGHFLMMDQPDLVFQALSAINKNEA